MRPAYPLLLLLLWMTALAPAYGTEQTVLIKKVDITGNRVTRESYIRSLLTFDEGKTYRLDVLLNEINMSRENLNSTGLFENVFFNDEVMEENTPSGRMIINLSIQVKEKNYFQFGPAGYLGFEDHDFYAKTAVYFSYTNLFGNTSRIYMSVPLYTDSGISIDHTGPVGNLRYRFGYAYINDKFLDSGSHTITAGLGYENNALMKPGAFLQLVSADLFTLAFFPYIQVGSTRRPADRRRTWYSVQMRPFFGYNFDHSHFYGLINTAGLYHDIFLKIVYSLQTEAAVGTGSFPERFLFYSNVRGTQFQKYSDTYYLSVSNEFNIPWPSNNRVNIVPFFDMNYLADTFLIGGGIGLHLFTRYQTPLVLDVAFGRGIMLNFNVQH